MKPDATDLPFHAGSVIRGDISLMPEMRRDAMRSQDVRDLDANLKARSSALEAENSDLRLLLAKAGIDAAEQEVARKLQRVLLEELHHRGEEHAGHGAGHRPCGLRAAQRLTRASERSKAVSARSGALMTR